MIDGVILIAIILPVFMAMFVFMVQIANGDVGTKGITKPYRTKSGKLRTAKKYREEHIE